MKSGDISGIVLAWMVLVSAESTIVDQIVHDFPIPDTTGTHWIIYDVTDPQNRWTDEDDPAALTIQFGTGIFWSADIGFNFPLPTPAPGDTLVVIGSWDSAYVNNPDTYEDNVNHTGFYWLFSDTLDDLANTSWRDDTLRPLPWPAVFVCTNDSVDISIMNPLETRYPGQTTYDVLGFDLWADSTGTGIPSSFDVHIGFFPTSGGTGGDYSYIRYYGYDYYQIGRDYWLIHAYRLVSKPLFQSEQELGYVTYYLSPNSGLEHFPYQFTGVDEKQGIEEFLPVLFAVPNPFTRITKISFSLAKSSIATMAIYTASGQLVSTLIDEVKQAGEYTVVFDGGDLPSGVYFCLLMTPDVQLKAQLTVLR